MLTLFLLKIASILAVWDMLLISAESTCSLMKIEVIWVIQFNLSWKIPV